MFGDLAVDLGDGLEVAKPVHFENSIRTDGSEALEGIQARLEIVVLRLHEIRKRGNKLTALNWDSACAWGPVIWPLPAAISSFRFIPISPRI